MAEPQPILKPRVLKSTVAIRVRNVVKSYPGVRALRGVDFELDTGEVHGLVGANGAGKSTLIRMFSGAAVPDAGEIEIEGSPIAFDDPRMRRGAGIAAIYQELTIIPEMTALSNVFLGAVPRRFGLTDRGAMRRRFGELARWMGLSIAPDAKAGTLSVANQQMLEIMRAVQADQNVLIMDEPTAPLGPFERARLYDLIARLKASRVSIIFISHDLDEVMRVCDRVSVMRDGQLIETRPAAAWDKASLVQAMLGDIEVVPGTRRALAGAAALLSVRGLTVRGKVEDIAFDLRAGEVLGIAGLVGSGRTETLRAIAGDDPTAEGTMTVDGRPVAWPRSVRAAIAHGIMLAPEDRKRLGLVLSRSALVNLVLADLASVTRAGLIDRSQRRQKATALARRLGFDPARLDTDALNLSGGNQQKLVLGKWLHRGPRILLLDEPTRGIDLGAKQEIFRTIRRLSDEGMGVILVSSDLDEVIEHADRVLVMARGRRIGLLEAGEASVERVLNLIFEVEDRASASGVPA